MLIPSFALPRVRTWKLLPAVLLLASLAGTALAKPCIQSRDDDTVRILLTNPTIRVEATQALNDLYNFNFDKANQQFRWLKQKYGWHPLPYFLLGLSVWWNILPNPTYRGHDQKFIAYMDTAIFVAEHLIKSDPSFEIEGNFFLAAAHGFKGRLYTETSRKEWIKAASEGQVALACLRRCEKGHELSPELLFGDALYNYFSVWIPENYPILKPLLWFFRKGNKALGLSQLTDVSYNAFYTRTEAMIWLMQILANYEGHPDKALQIAEYLHQTYPENSYFHRYYARILYANGLFSEAQTESLEILRLLDLGKLGYCANDGRYVSYFLGEIYQMNHDVHQAKKYYLLTLQYAQIVGDTNSEYCTRSLLELGLIAEKGNNRKEAIIFFTEAKEKSARKSYVFEEAKKRLRRIRQ